MADAAPDDFVAWVLGAQASLLRSAFLISGSPPHAEDLLQEALIKVAQRWPRLRDGNPTGYARRIIYRDHISWWRRRRDLPTAVPLEPDGHLERRNRDDEDAVPRRLMVVEALRGLPPRQRAVIVLRYLDDLTERETAEILGVTVGTVKSQAALALRRLREDDGLAMLLGKEPQ